MYGAAILYNWMLAEEVPMKEKATEYKEMFADWAREMVVADARIRRWNLPRLWEIHYCFASHYTPITRKSQQFHVSY